jgi:hypothetical protein
MLYVTKKSPATEDRAGKVAFVTALLEKKKSPATSVRLGKARADWFMKATEKSSELDALWNNAKLLPPLCIEVRSSKKVNENENAHLQRGDGLSMLHGCGLQVVKAGFL